MLKTYRRIEVNAFRRRVTVVSGEWPIVDIDDLRPAQVDDGVSLNDTDSCEPVTPDSPEGQVILVEAVRSLESRLSPETRAARGAVQEIPARASGLCRELQSVCQFIYREAVRLRRREKVV
jgi:hypothetical protein